MSTPNTPVSTPPQRQRSGGRSARVRESVGQAVLDLLTEGRIDFTTLEVAERADVSRRTLYRWWPTQEDLLAEALGQHAHSIVVPDTGNWRDDARTFAHRIAAFATAPVDLALARILATGQYPTLQASVMAHFEGPMTEWNSLLERAVRRGEVNDRHSPRTVINTLVSPLFLAPLTTNEGVSPETVDQIVDLVLDATAPR